MQSRVSVIIPIYNVEEFLEECIDSALAQTLNNLELEGKYDTNLQIILIDDGSTDNCANIGENYANKYDNVEYYRIPNQGLGHARNYGLKFAKGDYIVFLDSDDIVPPKAYELMYKAAIRNNSDVVMGSVWRFNSKNTWYSDIHEIAFNNDKECTHIRESNEIIYDTIACNKLIRKSFWDENNFSFPEGRYYEDIPVIIPMQYLANNVSRVYENCYLWRVREGLSKSITQQREDTKNLEDRLYSIGEVDKFFEKYVEEEDLIRAKWKKWLKIDLMIFIRKLKDMKEEYAQESMDLLCDYINKNIKPEYFEYLNEIEKLEYEYLLNKDLKHLTELLKFEEGLKSSKLYRKNSHIIVKGNKKLLKNSQLCIDKYIREGHRLKYVTNLSFKKENIEIEGYVVIPGLEDKNFSDREYSFYLINSDSRQKIPLEYKDMNISKYNIPYANVSYKGAGYKLYIPYEKIKDNPNFMGENRIVIKFTQDNITHTLFAGGAVKKVRDKNNLNVIKGNTYFSIKYELNNEIIINLSKIKYKYENIGLEDDKLFIESSQYNGEMVIHYEANCLDKEQNIPLNYNEKNKVYEVDTKKLPYLNGTIKYLDGTNVIHNSKELKFFDDGRIIANTLNDYYYNIKKVDCISIASIKSEKNIITINSKIYPNSDKLNSANLYIKDDNTEIKHYISKGEIKNSNEIEFKIDIKKSEIIKNLYQGFFNINVECKFENNTLSTPLYLSTKFNYKYSYKGHRYEIYRDEDNKLMIKSTKRWNWHTGYRRRQIALKAYKFFKLLPINKKRIIFESMWGTKYSCNPRYLYEYINKNYPEYECVWSLTDENIPIKGNGTCIRRQSLKYFYYLATSKYFVNNVNFNDHYTKRNGQVEIQTMHGTPLKTIGLDVPNDFKTLEGREKFIKRCNRWDYLTVQSDFVSKISKKAFKFMKESLNYGYPRTDILYTKNNEKDIEDIKKRLGLPLDKKIILYAPTWRGKNKFDLMLDIKSLKESLSDEYILILRLHHFVSENIVKPNDDEFIYDLSKYDSIEELYLISDILITDYSSVMFDYAILDRPIILFSYDYNEYKNKLRGVYVDIEDESPGKIVYTSKELEEAIININQIEKETKDLRRKFQEKFLQYESKDSSEKIFNTVINNKK